MRAVIQRVNSTQLFVGGELVSKIGKGVLVFVGLCREDSEEDLDFFLNKIPNLRIFEDENGKMNLNIKQINGEILLVSQFTLHADASHGNRPSFIDAMPFNEASVLFHEFVERMSKRNETKCGVFGADMKIAAQLDGPVTIILDSRKS